MRNKAKKILIVDDQEYNINAIMIILRFQCKISESIECDKALNGQDALEIIIKDIKNNKFKCCSYDLILMDCNMPFMDGYEATTKIRQYIYEMELPQPLISAVTGHTEM